MCRRGSPSVNLIAVSRSTITLQRRGPDADALKLVDDHSSLGVHIDVIAMAVLAGGGVVAVSLACGADDLVTGQALQCDGGFQVLAHRVAVGALCEAARRGCQYPGKVD